MAYPQYHRVVPGLTLHGTKALFVNTLATRPINFLVEAPFGVNRSSTTRGWVRIPLARTHDSFTRSEEQYLHEQFLSNVPAKIFFDLDLKKAMTEEEKDAFLARFIRTVCKRLPSEMGTIDSDFIVMESIHVHDVCTSFHVVINNNYHLHDTRSVGDLIKACFNKQKDGRTINVLQDKYGVDMAVYGTEKSLRCIGGCKWQDPRSIFTIRGLVPSDTSYSKYVSCFVQSVLPTSVLYVHNNAASQSQRGEVARATALSPVDVQQRPYASYIERALAFVRRSPGNENAIVSSCTDSGARDKHFVVQFDFARTCHYMQYYDRPPNIRSIAARIFPEMQLMQIVCPASCDCRALVRELGATDYASQCIAFIRTSLPLLRRLGLDRVDMPITEDEWGRRCLTLDMVDETVPGIDDYCFHPERDGTGMPWSTLIWSMLRRTRDYEMMNVYWNLFINENVQKDLFALRSVDGYKYLNKGKMETTTSGLQYEEPIKKKKKDDPQEYKTCPFSKPWLECKYGERRTFAKGRMGQFRLFEPRPAPDLNLLPAPKTNMMRSLLAYRHEKEQNSALTDMLRAAWNTYLFFVTVKEDDDRKETCRAWIERYIHLKLFQPGRKIKVNVFLASEDGGTGKTWLGEVIIGALGDDHAMICRDMETFKGRFLTGANRTFILMDEAIGDAKEKKTQGTFKALTTAALFTSANKGGEEFETQTAVMDFMFTSNTVTADVIIPGVQQDFDRRNFAAELPSRREQEQYLANECAYECQHCDEVRCKHSYNSFPRFWTIMQEGVKSIGETEGVLSDVFLGMLFDDYLSTPPNRWPVNFGTIVPVTRLVEKQQALAADPVHRWFDKKCMTRGWTVCPFADGPNLWLSQGNQLKVAAFPVGQMLDEGGEAQWIENVCLSTLHKQFQYDTGNRDIDEEAFERQLHSLSKSRRNNVELTVRKLECMQYVYKVQCGDQLPGWSALRNMSSRMAVITLPKMEPVKAVNFLAAHAAALAAAADGNTVQSVIDFESMRSSSSRAVRASWRTASADVSHVSQSVEQVHIRKRDRGYDSGEDDNARDGYRVEEEEEDDDDGDDIIQYDSEQERLEEEAEEIAIEQQQQGRLKRRAVSSKGKEEENEPSFSLSE